MQLRRAGAPAAVAAAGARFLAGAPPVRRIMLHIAGAATEQNIADSDTVCNALQVLEHCQDVGEDARAGRVYVPAADLPEGAHLLATSTSPEVRAAVEIQVDRAVEML